MATLLVIYKTSNDVIVDTIDDLGDNVWDNSGTYVADGYVQVDGVKRVIGLDTGNYAIYDFTGTPPANLVEKCRGSMTDPDPVNWIYPEAGFYKFDATKENIIEA